MNITKGCSEKVNIYLNIFEKKLCFITYLYEKVTINNFLILKVMIYKNLSLKIENHSFPTGFEPSTILFKVPPPY